jgi:hypothetical protein
MSTITFDPNGSDKFPNIAFVEGFLGGVGRLVFTDNTLQFAENETYPDVIYSPRLTEIELELFCKNNIGQYEKYFDDNFEAIDQGGELPPINRFWENSSN